MLVSLKIAVSLDCFLLVYCLLSVLVEAVWRFLRPLHVAQQSVATILIGLRLLPLVASLIVTFALVVPSFQLMKPVPINERVGAIPVALGVCALLLIAGGFFRAIAAQSRTTRAVTCWLEGARPLEANANANSTVTFQSRESPPLIVVGVRRPRVLVSESTVALLTPDELRMALKHEHEHMKSRDNLKRLILVFCPFPGMARLESAWSQAAELAADDAAVSNPRDALDLAAALVKLSRLVPVKPPVCSMGFVAGSISERVARLLDWDEASKSRRVHIRAWFVIPFAVAVSLLVSVAHGPVLTLTHEVTEWLVR
jgi:beta-lactamase regulating signal transducer with metallopeptidase domain